MAKEESDFDTSQFEISKHLLAVVDRLERRVFVQNQRPVSRISVPSEDIAKAGDLPPIFDISNPFEAEGHAAEGWYETVYCGPPINATYLQPDLVYKPRKSTTVAKKYRKEGMVAYGDYIRRSRRRPMSSRREFDRMVSRAHFGLWENGSRLKVGFMESTREHDALCVFADIRCPARTWEHVANIQFDFDIDYRPRAGSEQQLKKQEASSADIKIQFVYGEGQTARYLPGLSALYQPAHAPTIILCCDANNTMHEFGHALGFGHEHQRPISGLASFDVNKLRAFQEDTWVRKVMERGGNSVEMDPFPYDMTSVMHYSMPPGAMEELGKAGVLSTTRLSTKDLQLAAYWYLRPQGAMINLNRWINSPREVVKLRRQKIVLHQPWSISPRILLGLTEISWDRTASSFSVDVWTSERGRGVSHFLLRGEISGLARRPRIAYLATAPGTQGLQTSSGFVFLKRTSSEKQAEKLIDELYTLKPWTQSNAKAIPWLRSLRIANTKSSFMFRVNMRMWLEKGRHKTIQITAVTSSWDLHVQVDWLVISPDAINIDGGVVHWKAAASANHLKQHYCSWSRKRLRPIRTGNGICKPDIITSVTAVKYNHCPHLEPHNPFFGVKIHRPSMDGFYWTVKICHPECVSELSFSWVVAMKPPLERFRLPGPNDRDAPKPMTLDERLDLED